MALLQHQADPNPNELHVPCTKSGDVSCQLLEHRATINKVLLDIGLEIGEDHRQVGGVRMAASPTPACNSFFSLEPNQWLELPSMNLAHDLIASHRCFTSLEMYSTTPWPKRVRRAIKRGSAVKCLTVYVVLRHGGAKLHEGIFTLVSSLTSLEELAFKEACAPHHGLYNSVRGQLLGQSVKHLMTLDVGRVLLGPKNAVAFLWALTDNPCVTDFTVNWRTLRAGLTGPGKLGSLYLPRRLAILRKLRLTDSEVCRDRVLWLRLTKAFAEMAKLEELYVNIRMEFEIYTAVSEGLAQVVLRCTKLRRLQLPTSSPSRESPKYDDQLWPVSLIDAVKEPREMRDLYISVAGMDETQLETLFAAVQSNRTLKNVVIWDGLYTHDGVLNIELLSRLTRERSLSDTISIEQELLVCSDNSLEVAALPKLCTLKFLRLKFRLYSWHAVELLACCKMLCRRGAMTIFEVSCSMASAPTFVDWLSWLAESTALTHVIVVAFSRTCTECAEMCDMLVSALANNSAIVKLGLVEFTLETAHLDALCQNAREHRSLTEFVLTPACRVFGEVCPPSCDLLTEEFREAALQLQDVVRHNASLMCAAVKFVLGEVTVDGGSAVEQLHDNRWLPERVRDEADVTDAEAEKKVKRAVMRLRYSDVHDFLWMTGVVRERRATRLDPDARGLHILDLPLLCWWCIREYLKFTDVASG
ncbi:hypothetical protein MTO96_037374 [Rhipicephalus appendiculatus]